MRLGRFTRNRNKPGLLISGKIAEADEQQVTVKLLKDVLPYRKGEHIIVSLPRAGQTALGKDIQIAEVVASGRIADITKNTVVIRSMSDNPIISQMALRENKGKEREFLVRHMDY